VINPYDPCVANKMIEGEHMTICFHVDEYKLSHRTTKVVDSMIDYLRQEYESIFEDGYGAMTVSRGKIHKYLGMTLYYTIRGQVKITMFNYIDEILTTFDKAEPKGGGTKTSEAPDSLFKVDGNCEKLKQDKAVEFHNLYIVLYQASQAGHLHRNHIPDYESTITRQGRLEQVGPFDEIHQRHLHDAADPEC
jgi:hypothetical protein